MASCLSMWKKTSRWKGDSWITLKKLKNIIRTTWQKCLPIWKNFLSILVLDFLFYKDCLYLNKICFHTSKCVVCCPCQLLLICIVPILNMSVKLLKSQVCENMANPIWRLHLDVRDNSQRAFLTRSCRTQRFNPDHLMLVHNFHIQTFPPFVTFVLSRIDLRLR